MWSQVSNCTCTISNYQTHDSKNVSVESGASNNCNCKFLPASLEANASYRAILSLPSGNICSWPSEYLYHLIEVFYLLATFVTGAQSTKHHICRNEEAFHTHFIVIHCLSLQMFIIYICYLHKILVLRTKLHFKVAISTTLFNHCRMLYVYIYYFLYKITFCFYFLFLSASFHYQRLQVALRPYEYLKRYCPANSKRSQC